ncbi:MAG: PAS domain S-box protein, partial [Verrucomicrobiota bacterium]|nr:PAS domain S-box protein [Verrucomicrobiota bacterium]
SADEEIQFLKEQLANTIEQYEATHEELKASNEELQAMNEEMRSATEELETSKEELQSVNEELTTVNHELKANVEELSLTNTDLNNLMASTDIGTIFLNRELRIHRFTPSAQKIFNLIPADLGRPISDITSRLHYDGFLRDLEEVLRDLQTTEREVQVGNGDAEREWYLTRIAPYRTGDDRIAGVVATFINITARKKAEEELRSSETELRSSEARLRRAFEIETVGVIYFSVDGIIAHGNSAFLQMSGYSAEDLAKQQIRWDRMTPSEFLPRKREAIEEFKRTGRISTYEQQYIRKDGTRWWALFSGTRLNEELGVEFIVDITDRKQIEQALQASEERMRTIADNVPPLIWTNDANGDAIYFNKRFLDYTGLTTEEARGPGWQAVVHPSDAPPSTERWRQAFAKGEVFDAEYRLRGRDGGYRWFLGRNVPLRRDGEVLSWFGSATDIDELKQAQANLAETDEKFRLLVENARDYAMFLLDQQNVITYWSKGAERVFGWTAEEAVGQSGEIIFTPEDQATEQEEKEIETALRDGRAPDRRWHVRKDRRRIWADGVMHRLDYLDTGSLRGFAKIARDATEQRNTEEALRHAHDEMEQRVLERTADLMATNHQLQRAINEREQLEGELLRISEREKRRIGEDLHDMICQELTATALFLKSSAKRLESTVPAAVQPLEEAAQTVNSNVGFARDLARHLHPVELTSSGLPAALRAMTTQIAESKGIDCDFEMPRSVRVANSNVALQLFRIAQEAVVNAAKHSAAECIRVTLDRTGHGVRLRVEDDGKGLPKKLPRGNKGLGVHIMHYRANVIGGTLSVSRREEGGTRVECVVPLTKEKARDGKAKHA